ncbi:hypothetical protein G7K_2829-t1 [Saitoella complicata NRRL Y-17804]|uniref:Uncharacterized protein n=1 Tax=Saitoella complicata (strain BCRC 22490 / CBS 7301 / JCM 7358 / NBRC 10748 / NRRL Y-17804) TaxID=698492 RepID=A0A0E9NFP4_SAICN|nr:hypothetical protein G7K_2829-t1 [Saitoella complicata NRRL Y-17804]
MRREKASLLRPDATASAVLQRKRVGMNLIPAENPELLGSPSTHNNGAYRSTPGPLAITTPRLTVQSQRTTNGSSARARFLYPCRPKNSPPSVPFHLGFVQAAARALDSLSFIINQVVARSASFNSSSLLRWQRDFASSDPYKACIHTPFTQVNSIATEKQGLLCLIHILFLRRTRIPSV